MIDDLEAFSEFNPPPESPPPDPPPKPPQGVGVGSYTDGARGRDENSEFFSEPTKTPPGHPRGEGGGGEGGEEPTRPPGELTEPDLHDREAIVAIARFRLGSLTKHDVEGVWRLAQYVLREPGIKSPCGVFSSRLAARDWPAAVPSKSPPGAYHEAMGRKTRELFEKQERAKDDAVTPEQAAAYRQKIHDIMFKWTSEQRQACMPEWRRILGMEPE